MHSGFMAAFGGHRAAFVAPIGVIDIRAPKLFERAAVLESEMDDERFDAKCARIEAEFIARHECHVPQIGREADEELGPPRLQKFYLESCRRLGAGASNDRYGAGIFPDSFPGQDAAIGQS